MFSAPSSQFMDYRDIPYMNVDSSAFPGLDTVYHSGLRFITNLSYTNYHCKLYSLLFWSSFKVRQQRHWLIFTYKAILGKLPVVHPLHWIILKQLNSSFKIDQKRYYRLFYSFLDPRDNITHITTHLASCDC